MKVKELKLLLSELDDDLEVVVDGYEDGISDITPSITNIYDWPSGKRCSVYGDYYKEGDQFEQLYLDTNQISNKRACLLLSRNNNDEW